MISIMINYSYVEWGRCKEEAGLGSGQVSCNWQWPPGREREYLSCAANHERSFRTRLSLG
jgi:hypothetical protein